MEEYPFKESIRIKVKELNENDLRKYIVIPLMRVIFKFAKNNHGVGENGIDVHFISEQTVKHFSTPKDEFVGIILKAKESIKKSRGNKTNEDIRDVARQVIESSFREFIPYGEKYKRKLDRIIVVNNGEINQPALDFWNDYIKNSGIPLSSIDLDKLVELINDICGDTFNDEEKLTENEFEKKSFSNICDRYLNIMDAKEKIVDRYIDKLKEENSNFPINVNNVIGPEIIKSETLYDESTFGSIEKNE